MSLKHRAHIWRSPTWASRNRVEKCIQIISDHPEAMSGTWGERVASSSRSIWALQTCNRNAIRIKTEKVFLSIWNHYLKSFKTHYSPQIWHSTPPMSLPLTSTCLDHFSRLSTGKAIARGIRERNANIARSWHRMSLCIPGIDYFHEVCKCQVNHWNLELSTNLEPAWNAPSPAWHLHWWILYIWMSSQVSKFHKKS